MSITAEPPPSVSPRQAAGLFGVGIAAATTPALTLGSNPQTNTPRNTEPAMDDPRTKYPQPPFKPQTQPWPGLATKMDPKPDHGEKSYRGADRLAGRKALITGGDSGMGRAA